MTASGSGGVDAALAALRTISTTVQPDFLFFATSRQDDSLLEVSASRPTNDLASALRELALKYASDWTDREPIPYGPATELADGQVMWVPATDVVMLADSAVQLDAADVPTFDPAGEHIRRLKLSAIRAETSTGRALFYRGVSPTQALFRSGKLLPIFVRGDRMDLAGPNTLVIERAVDAILVEGIVLFDNRKRFQRVFGFLEQLREHAGETFDDVMSKLRIANLDDMRAAATTQLQMLGKMASIARKLRDYPAYRDALTMENLVEFVKQNPHTGVTIQGDGADAEFVFEPDPRKRFKILKLLDDDFLQSQLTKLAYESNSKGLPLS